jgi:Ca2+-binding RTX toxin-like protein
MATASLTPVLIGQAGDTAIYRLDLTQSGFNTINAITIADDNVISGGSGAVSGIELDFVKLSSTSTASASAVASLSGEDAFNFSPSGIVFNPGFLQPWSSGDNPNWNKPYLSGTNANIYSPDKATLSLRDGSVSNDTGSVSLGEGGKIQFLLGHVVSTDGKYLYIGERNGADDHFFVTVSGEDSGSPGEPVPSPGTSGIHLIGTPSRDTILLGQGINRHLGTGNDTIEGLAGNDRLGGADGNDKIYGGVGHDWIYGGFGNDRAYGSAGNDKVYGNAGIDRVYGGSGHDTVDGGSGNDWVYGDSGNDRVYGGIGNDVVNGGAGNDRLHGGAGSDAFMFNTRLGTASTDRKVNFDTIVDFNVRYDSLWLDNAVFKKLGSGTLSNPKQLNKNFFSVGDEAKDRNDYLIYNKKTGVLSYDADGSGSKEAVEFARLSKNLKLTYKDFFVT